MLIQIVSTAVQCLVQLKMYTDLNKKTFFFPNSILMATAQWSVNGAHSKCNYAQDNCVIMSSS